MYDPTIGRWLTQDPSGLGPDSNPYRYVGNDPMDATDPTGLWKKDPRDAKFWATTLGKDLAKRLDDAEAYLKKTCEQLIKDLGKANTKEKLTIASLFTEITTEVGKLTIRPTIYGEIKGLPHGAQATPDDGSKAGAFAAYFDVLNLITVRRADDMVPYEGKKGAKPYLVDVVSALRIDKDSIYAMCGAKTAKDKETIDGQLQFNADQTSKANKGLPAAKVAWWGTAQIAALLSNEILHRISDLGIVEGWKYEPQYRVPKGVTYRVRSLRTIGNMVSWSEAALWDEDLALGTFLKDKPTYDRLTRSDAIYQAIADGKWPTIKK